MKLGWTKTSNVSRAPGTATSAGHNSAVILSATGLSNSTSSDRIAAAAWRSVVIILTWSCINLRRPGEVTMSPDCWSARLQGLQPLVGTKVVSAGPLKLPSRFFQAS